MRAAIQAVPEKDWEPYGDARPEEIRECAEVPFVPGAKAEKKDAQPLRYGAIRIRRKQDELFEAGSRVRHFAVLSNRWELTPGRVARILRAACCGGWPPWRSGWPLTVRACGCSRGRPEPTRTPMQQLPKDW